MTDTFYNDDAALWVDDADDEEFDLMELLSGGLGGGGGHEEGSHHMPEHGEVMIVDESDEDEPMVVEEDMPEIVMVPGSDTEFIEEEEEEDDTADHNWADDGSHAQFTQYLKDRMSSIPKHSGETVSGCERAKAFLNSLDSEISKALRSDLKGVIDESEVDGLRTKIEDMSDRLEKQIKKLKGSGKTASLDVQLVSEAHCNKCESVAPVWHDVDNDSLVCMHCEAETIRDNDELEKTATTPRLNVYMTPFERAIVGIMVNSKVSAGRNIEETYDKLKNKYNFTPREELAIQQLVADHGYPVYKDRGLLNEPHDPSSGDGVDFQTNYHA